MAKKGFYEIRKLPVPMRTEIGEYLECTLCYLEDTQFLDEITDLLETSNHLTAASLIADKRLLDYTRKVIQLTEEKIAFESKKSVDNGAKVA